MNEKFDWVKISNPRAEREFDFLLKEVGEEKIIAARALLGARSAFPLNLARVMGVKLPDHLKYLPAIEAREKIQDLRRRLRSAGGGVGVQRKGMGPSGALDLSRQSGLKGGDHA